MSFIPSPLERLVSATPILLWVIFIGVTALFAVVSWVLHYHWREYGMGKQAVVGAETAYFVVSMGIIASAFVSLLAI